MYRERERMVSTVSFVWWAMDGGRGEGRGEGRGGAQTTAWSDGSRGTEMKRERA